MDPNLNTPQPQPLPQQPITPSVQPVGPTVQSPSNPPKKFFSKKLIFIVLGILGALILVFILVRLFASRSSKDRSNEIVWWGLWEEESYIQPLIDEYEKANPKAKVKYIKQAPQDYRERLTNALAKGTGPDIYTIHNSWVPMFKNDLDILPSTVMTPSEYAQTFYPVAVSDFTTDQGIVAIPLEYDGLTLFINEDIFSKAGKAPPKTWDELRSTASELTKKDEQGRIIQSGVSLGRTENVDHWQEILALMMLQNGVDLQNPQGELAEGALSFFTIFSKGDGVWDATLPTSTLFFSTGNLAMYFGPSWRVFEIEQQNPNLKYRAVALPQLAKDNPSDPDVSYSSYWAQGVWTRSTKKEKAWEFVKFLSSKESLEKLYKNEAGRGFGEPYPRVDMQELLKDHPLIGPIVSQAKDGQSWFLQSRTFDGPTGINSQISKYFEDAVNAVNAGDTPEKALGPVKQGVNQVLSQYGLVK